MLMIEGQCTPLARNARLTARKRRQIAFWIHFAAVSRQYVANEPLISPSSAWKCPERNHKLHPAVASVLLLFWSDATFLENITLLKTIYVCIFPVITNPPHWFETFFFFYRSPKDIILYVISTLSDSIKTFYTTKSQEKIRWKLRRILVRKIELRVCSLFFKRK